MAKSYIHQLSGGNMLVYQDGWFGVEKTGYPLPECSLTVGGKTLKKQQDILRVILGYDIEDSSAFVAEVTKFEPMTFEAFKNKIISEDIGGGCPAKLQVVQAAVHAGLSQKLAMFKYILPLGCVDIDCVLPSEEDLVAEYGDLLNISWSAVCNTPNWKFRNNIVMLTGCREVTDKHIEYIRDVVAICMLGYEKSKYNYIVGVTLSNGNGAVILCDSYINDSDLCYLYQRVTGADLSVGKINSKVEEDGSFTVSYEYVESGVRKRKMPEIHGVVRRHNLW